MIPLRLCGVAALLALLTLGCSGPTYSPPTRVENVTRVLMHERNHYTLLVEEPDGTVTQIENGYYCLDVPQLYHDVPAGQPMWAETRTKSSDGSSDCLQIISIHLHTAEDINGAGWNHGKFGSGQTTVVE